jgi:hypothetical protein
MAYESASHVSISAEEVAVAICPGTFGSHMGIAVTDMSGAAQLLHFGWHRALLKDAYPMENWAACKVALDEWTLPQLSGVARGVLDSYEAVKGSLTYGIDLFASQGAVNADGSIEQSPSSDGHTCATFVVDVFRAASIPIVDLDSWKPSPEGEAWGTAVACCLEAYGAQRGIDEMPGHVATVRANNKGIRVKPEEVAAAAVMSTLGISPGATQEQTREPAEEIMMRMHELCVSGPPSSIFNACVDEYKTALADIASRSI